MPPKNESPPTRRRRMSFHAAGPPSWQLVVIEDQWPRVRRLPFRPSSLALLVAEQSFHHSNGRDYDQFCHLEHTGVDRACEAPFCFNLSESQGTTFTRCSPNPRTTHPIPAPYLLRRAADLLVLGRGVSLQLPLSRYDALLLRYPVEQIRQHRGRPLLHHPPERIPDRIPLQHKRPQPRAHPPNHRRHRRHVVVRHV